MARYGTRGRGISSGELMGRMASQDRRAQALKEREKNPSEIRIAQLRHHATAEGIPADAKARALAKLAALGIPAEPLGKRTYRYGDPR